MPKSDATDSVKRFRRTLDLFEFGESMARQKLRNANPNASDEEIDRLMRDWYADQPPHPGREVSWPRRHNDQDDQSK